MTTIYLVRHGQVENPEEIIYTRLDEEIVLSEKGKKQIESQADKLAKLQIKAIYHSPLKRTAQTAEILESHLNTGQLVPDPRLMDTKTPVQGMKLKEFDEKWGGILYHPELLAQGGESMDEVWLRMKNALKEIAVEEDGQSVAVVSHGDPIRIVTMVAEGKPLTREGLGSDRHPVGGIQYPEKGSVTVLEIDGEKVGKKEYWKAVATNPKF